ncbi:unnamed protein product, partial [Effrenium voratum]
APEDAEASRAEIAQAQTKAAKLMFSRKDTTQLEAEQEANCRVECEDGTVMYKGPGGRLETHAERQSRLAHNCYMRFSRSLKCRDLPPSVMEAAKKRKHNKSILDSLFEDWLSAGEDWSESSIVLNHKSTETSKKRGRYVMKPYRTLKELHGKGMAEKLLQRKQEQQRAKGDAEPNWVEAHPDFPDVQDYMLLRVWDSTEFSEEEETSTSKSHKVEANVDSDQTRVLVKSMMGQRGLASGAPAAPAAAPPAPQDPAPPRAPKKSNPYSFAKVISGKLSVVSGKLTDVICWESKIQESSLSDQMKQGYKEELLKRKQGLQNTREALEAWYTSNSRTTDEDLSESAKTSYESLLGQAESITLDYAGLLKTLKPNLAPASAKKKASSKK